RVSNHYAEHDYYIQFFLLLVWSSRANPCGGRVEKSSSRLVKPCGNSGSHAKSVQTNALHVMSGPGSTKTCSSRKGNFVFKSTQRTMFCSSVRWRYLTVDWPSRSHFSQVTPVI